jgi:hypothetical protein
MSALGRAARLLGVGLPAAAAVGLGAWARDRFERRSIFVPDRYPNGIWNPTPYGLRATDVWFESLDGTDLHGWWIPHRRARATLLYCHGNSGSIAHQIGAMRFLRRLRTNLFLFDYRGYGRSGGRPSEAGLYRDVRAAWRQVVEVLGQAPSSVLLFGHSLGGAVAIDCALDHVPAGLIVQSSFTDMRQAARAVFPTLPVHWMARSRFRSLDKVGRLETPKLFVHGAEDGSLPVAMSERLHAAASDPKDLYVVRGAGHNDVYRHGGLAYLRRLGRFIEACVSAR